MRTALYNWLVARQGDGAFILRIEDTDVARNRQEWVQGIFESLRWIGLDWDECYRQSERSALYKEAAEKLFAGGLAYWCDCPREAIDARAAARKGPPGYDGFCRDKGLGPGEGRALRFRTPDTGTTVVPDVIRGAPSFENATLDDPVIVRSSGDPMFLLANVVDDLDMAITHVIRGEEHLPTTPKYLLLWSALDGPEAPTFAHVPVLVNEKRQKLSKRRDPVALEQYRDEGYLADVMLNYLALLGWSSPDGRERFSVEDMLASFRLEDVGSSPAFFDVAKLRAFNGDAIRAMSTEAFIAAADPWLKEPHAPWKPDAFDKDTFARIAPLVQERVARLDEVTEMVDFLFLDEAPGDESSWSKAMKPHAAALLDAVISSYEQCPWNSDDLKATLINSGDELGLKLKVAQAPVRVAITGRTVGPPLFEALEIMGREVVLGRLRAARSRL